MKKFHPHRCCKNSFVDIRFEFQPKVSIMNDAVQSCTTSVSNSHVIGSFASIDTSLQLPEDPHSAELEAISMNNTARLEDDRVHSARRASLDNEGIWDYPHSAVATEIPYRCLASFEYVHHEQHSIELAELPRSMHRAPRSHIYRQIRSRLAMSSLLDVDMSAVFRIISKSM